MGGHARPDSTGVVSVFREVPLPRMRRTVSDIGWLTHNRYLMRGLLEVDVTSIESGHGIGE